MGMVDAIVLALILLILGGAVFFVCRAKKRGASCIGCPCQGNCSDCKK